MKKKDLLKLLENVEEDGEILISDLEGNYVDDFKIVEECVMGRFSNHGFEFFEKYNRLGGVGHGCMI